MIDNAFVSIGFFDSLAYGYLIYKNFKEIPSRNVTIETILFESDINIQWKYKILYAYLLLLINFGLI